MRLTSTESMEETGRSQSRILNQIPIVVVTGLEIVKSRGDHQCAFTSLLP
jgi:hypothetical protein